MAPDLQIETLSDDNKRSAFRSQRIRIASTTVLTPTRVLEPQRLQQSAPVDLRNFGLGELYREVNGTQLSSCLRDNAYLGDLDSRLRQLSRRAPAGSPRLCFVKFAPDRTLPWPDRAGVNLLSDVAHSFSDIVPLPTVGGDYDLESAGRVIAFQRACYDSVERLNNKPVMGALPILPREALVKLLDFYLDKGLRAFYVDFSGTMPDPLKLRPILARLNERKILGKSLIYGLNARPGRLLRNADAILSRDFIAFGYGLDCLGGRHFRVFVPGPKALTGRLKQTADLRTENRRRLFARKDYGYHRADKESAVRALYPKDSKVPISTLLSDDYSKFGPLFNMEQQAIEAAHLARRLSELGRAESILDYVASKPLAKSEIPKLKRSTQRDLRGFE